ncbi:hypothetical protein DRQ53_10750 [bacterium]|nr:MAG: hypothetical protein DRQ32_04725 [bacterium]RKZ14763.1 MAG: hypothetical protein DRQ53_10750 [bacterium]
MRHQRSTFAVLILALIASCGGGDDGMGPDETDKIPLVFYTPTPDTLILVALDSLVLEVAVDPPQPFSVRYMRDDSLLVGEEARLVVYGDVLGVRRYEADVTVGKWRFDDDWTVRVVAELDLPTPAPAQPLAEAGSLPGNVSVEWDRPPGHEIEVELAGFEVAWSMTPIEADAFDLFDIVFVPDNPVGIRQRTEVSGLVEGQTYYFRVRSVDQLDRRSFPTSQVSSAATGSFQLSGLVAQIDARGWPAGVGSVIYEAGPVKDTTVPGGLFLLSGLPDREPLALRVVEGSGDLFLPILSTPLEAVDRQLQLILVPKQNVTYRHNDGLVEDIPLVDFMFEALRRGRGIPPYDFHPWLRYPVPVYVWEFEGTAPGNPLYHEAYAEAIDRWNDGAEGDQQLLEYVAVSDSFFDPADGPDPYGVIVRLYPAPSQNLGEVDYLLPSGGQIAEDDPQLLRVLLRRGLPSGALERVITHELGHVLGLSHVLSTTALMHATSDLAQGIPSAEELYSARFLRHGGPDMQSNWIELP